MFSRILIKLVDEAILPAIVLVVVRVLSVLLIGVYFGLDVNIDTAGFVYNGAQDFLLVNSYSTLAMVCAVAIGLFYVLIKSYIFHDTHIHPRIAAKLFSLRLSSFIQTSLDVYSQGAIWLSYAYLMMLASGAMWYFGVVYSWIFYVSLVLAVLGTYFLILDVEKELKVNNAMALNKIEEVTLSLEEKGGSE